MAPVHFRTRINPWFALVILGSLLVCVVTIIVLLANIKDIPLLGSVFTLLIITGSGGLLGWIWFDTGYHLEPEGFRYHSGPIRGFISYSKIRKIEVGKTAWAGIRPAMATRGIIVHYNTCDQVYITPDTNERFVNELRLLVDNLEVKYHV